MPTVHEQVLVMVIRIVCHFTVLFKLLSPGDLSFNWIHYCFALLLVALLTLPYDIFLKEGNQVTVTAVVVTVFLQKLMDILQLLKNESHHERLFSQSQLLVWVIFFNLFHNQHYPFMNQLYQLYPVHPAKIVPKKPRQNSPYQLTFPIQNPSDQLLDFILIYVFLSQQFV